MHDYRIWLAVLSVNRLIETKQPLVPICLSLIWKPLFLGSRKVKNVCVADTRLKFIRFLYLVPGTLDVIDVFL